MSKGSNRRPNQVPTAHVDSEYERIFGNKKPQPGRWRHDKVTGELIPIDEWYAKYGEARPQTHHIIPDIDPYISPVSEKWITSRKEHREDLKRTGSRVYEGRESEERAAARHREYEDKKFEKTIHEGVEKTYYQLRDGMIPREDRIKSSWVMGQD